MDKLILATLFLIIHKMIACLPATISGDQDTSKLLDNFYDFNSYPENKLSYSTSNLQPGSAIVNIENQLQPRDLVADILGSPLRPAINYFAGTLFGLGNALYRTYNGYPLQPNAGSVVLHAFGFSISFGNGSTLEPLQKHKIVRDIPVHEPGKSVTIEGKNGDILVNEVIKYRNDFLLRNHKVRVRIRNGGDIYVNDNLVLRKNPNLPLEIVVQGLDKDEVINGFKMIIDDKGVLHYGNTGIPGVVDFNYYKVPNVA